MTPAYQVGPAITHAVIQPLFPVKIWYEDGVSRTVAYFTSELDARRYVISQNANPGQWASRRNRGVGGPNVVNPETADDNTTDVNSVR